MTVHYDNGHAVLHHGDCLDVLRAMPAESVHAVVTDPPYGLANTDPAHVVEALTKWATGERDFIPTGKGFMGKAWDAFVPPPVVWDECMRVLKPGGHLLAFAGSRTFDLMTLSIRFAGFDIRDSIAWLYGTGFPKSMDVSKAISNADGADAEVRKWDGWGTALKPAFEPIIVARKPVPKTVAANVLEHGTGGLNIDASRIPHDEPIRVLPAQKESGKFFRQGGQREAVEELKANGRFPANVMLDEWQAGVLDEQAPHTGAAGRASGPTLTGGSTSIARGKFNGLDRPATFPGDGRAGASRFFYVAKAPSSERPEVDGTMHATVKPLDLMRRLAVLVTPPGGTVLDPFAGSGTTGEACMIEGFPAVLVEREAEHLPLIVQRLSKDTQPTMFGDDL